ncbi:MAG: oligosaccharide flippase family protein [Candidatus Promineifilaceae bacterium]
MSGDLVQRAGSALAWQTIQLGGLKLIFLLRLLILARLLRPDDFGLLTIAASAIGFMLSLTNFGIVEALVQGAVVNERGYNSAWTVTLGRALVVTAGVFLAAPLAAEIFSEPRSVELIRVLAFRPLLDALASAKVAGLTRDLHFRPLAALRLSEALANTVISIALALPLGVWSLVIGTLAGSITRLVISYRVAPHRPRIILDAAAIRPLLQFGRWIYFSSLIAMAGGNILRIAIARQLGAAELGLYYLASQIAFLPAEVASEVVGSVAFPLYARLQRNVQLAARVFRTFFSGMAALLYPASMLIIALAPSLEAGVLGPQWVGTAPIMRILALVSMIGLFGNATRPILRGLGQPQRATAVGLVQYALLVMLVWWLAGRFGAVGAAAAWLPAVAASQVISALFMTRLFPGSLGGLRSPLVAVVFASAAGGMAAYGLDRIGPGLASLILAIAAGSLVSYILLWLLERRFSLGFGHNLAHFFPQIARRVGIPPVEPTSA